jgi:hypothetical protein
MNTKPIQDFILTNERNMRIAVAVSEAWPEARNQLVSGFLDRLGSKLNATLKSWTFEYEKRWFIASYDSFYIWKPEWKDEYFVTLSCENKGTRMTFGISRDLDKEQVKKRGHCEDILNAIKQIHPTATVNNWWEAVMPMRTEGADWTKPEVLWRMHSDGTFLDEVANQLIEVARIAEPIVDRFIQAK